MKNLTIKKAIWPKLLSVKSVNTKFLYSVGAVLLSLSILLSIKGQPSNTKTSAHGLGTPKLVKSKLLSTQTSSYGADITNPDLSVVFENVGPGHDWYMNGFYNNDYGLTNNWGDSNSGNDRWIKLTITKSGILKIYCGTISGYDIYDSVIHLVDSTGTYELSSSDDGGGSYGLGGIIEYNIEPGIYYAVLDGTDKDGHVKNGGVGIDFDLYY